MNIKYAHLVTIAVHIVMAALILYFSADGNITGVNTVAYSLLGMSILALSPILRPGKYTCEYTLD